MSSVEILLPIEDINERIQSEYCKETWDILSDKKIFETNIISKQQQQKLVNLESHLKTLNLSNDQYQSILNYYKNTEISAGRKGNKKGVKFNLIVKDHVQKLKLDTDRFEIEFEKEIESNPTGDKPDWYILDKISGKTLIGMNQIDLWSGGFQQTKRGYYTSCDTNDNVKLLLVVAKKCVLKRKNSKIHSNLSKGFNQNRLCYIKNIENIIKEFFEI